MTEGDPAPPLGADRLDELDALIDGWCARQLAENPVVLGVERDQEPGVRRWFVRVAGDDKPVYAVWLTLRQRTLHYETYVAPSPPFDAEAVYRLVLTRNTDLYGVAYAIGEEDALYLVGRLPAGEVDDDELDRILGTIYSEVERSFRAVLRLGFRVTNIGEATTSAAAADENC